MEILGWILIYGTVIAIFGWFHKCNLQTFDQRQELLHEIHLHNIKMIFENVPYENVKRNWELFENVSYTKHTWYLFTFRDAKYLYRKVYQEIENGGTGSSEYEQSC